MRKRKAEMLKNINGCDASFYIINLCISDKENKFRNRNFWKMTVTSAFYNVAQRGYFIALIVLLRKKI